MHQTKTILLLTFVLMLSLQLSGMACLNDFLSLDSALQVLLEPSGTASNALDNDQCPCHVLFSQSDGMSLETDTRSAFMVPAVPITPALTHNHSFFHPPALL